MIYCNYLEISNISSKGLQCDMIEGGYDDNTEEYLNKTETTEECINLVKSKNSSALGMKWYPDYYLSLAIDRKKCYALFKAIDDEKVENKYYNSYFCEFKGIRNIVL